MPTDWIKRTIYATTLHPEHVHVFLTKNPKRLPEFNPWPANSYVGATTTDTWMFQKATAYLAAVDAPVRFVSIEPLLSWEIGRTATWGYFKERGITWVIIGAQTNPLRLPKREWVTDIELAMPDGVPIFEKASLATLFPERKLRQEYPK